MGWTRTTEYTSIDPDLPRWFKATMLLLLALGVIVTLGVLGLAVWWCVAFVVAVTAGDVGMAAVLGLTATGLLLSAAVAVRLVR